MELEKKYNVLTGARCYELIEERVKIVVDKLACSQELAYGLLLINEWNPEKATSVPFTDNEKKEEPGFLMSWFVSAPVPKSRDEIYLEYVQKHFNIDLMETIANAEKTKTLK